jgi:phospholipase/lecithinase/hemolysin
MSRMRRAAMAVALAATLALVGASAASATTVHFFGGSYLQAGTFYSVSAAHTNYYVEVVTQGPYGCPAEEQGVGEGVWTPGSTNNFAAGRCGKGTIGWYPTMSGYWHAAAYAGPGGGLQYFNDAHYSY